LRAITLESPSLWHPGWSTTENLVFTAFAAASASDLYRCSWLRAGKIRLLPRGAVNNSNGRPLTAAIFVLLKTPPTLEFANFRGCSTLGSGNSLEVASLCYLKIHCSARRCVLNGAHNPHAAPVLALSTARVDSTAGRERRFTDRVGL